MVALWLFPIDGLSNNAQNNESTDVGHIAMCKCQAWTYTSRGYQCCSYSILRHENVKVQMLNLYLFPIVYLGNLLVEVNDATSVGDMAICKCQAQKYTSRGWKCCPHSNILYSSCSFKLEMWDYGHLLLFEGTDVGDMTICKCQAYIKRIQMLVIQ